MQPLAIDLFCGLGGWTEGLMADQSVYDYMNHWEFRALKAEAALTELRERPAP